MDFKTNEEMLDEALKYSEIRADSIVKVFRDNHIYFPDFVYKFLLLNCFKKHIFNDAYMQLYSDEFKYKLRSYNFFSIHLLRKTIEDYNIDVKSSEFKNLFFRFYLKNEKKFKKSIILSTSLNELIEDKNSDETIYDCLKSFDDLFYTPKGYLDGISLSILKESIIATYSLPYLKDLGSKYGVNVPKRINKSELLDLVSTRFQLTDEERSTIESKSITEIISFSKKKGFKVSSDLKKSDMVEYIIFKLNKYNEEVEKDLYNYDILVESDLIENKIEQDNLEQTDQAIPTSEVMVENEMDDEDVKVDENVEPQDETEKEPEEVIDEHTESNEEELDSTENVDEPTNENDNDQESLAQEDTTTEEVETSPEEATIDEEESEPSKEETEYEQEDLSQPDIYYDQTVDEEIKNIIKKYYAKKLKKDTWLRIAVIAVFILVVVMLIYFALKYYKVF